VQNAADFDDLPWDGPTARARNDLFGEAIQIGLKFVDAAEILELPAIQRVEAGARRLPQSCELCIVIGGALFNQTQALAQR
jgi:hypothetical protein